VRLRSRLRRAAPALLAVHALRALWALLMLGPLYRELARALDRSVFHAAPSPGDAALALEVIARTGPQLLPAAFIWLGSYALLGPWLQQLLLHALARGASLRSAGRAALARYPAALTLRVLAVAAFALVASVALLALQQALAWLPVSPALELATWSLCALGLLGCALLLATAHDLAQAAVALGGGVAMALRTAFALCSRDAVARNSASLAAAAALAVIAELTSRAPLALPYASGPVLVLAVQQALSFAALLVRAAWLAHALVRVRPPPRS
jgi:hypothetical protein